MPKSAFGEGTSCANAPFARRVLRGAAFERPRLSARRHSSVMRNGRSGLVEANAAVLLFGLAGLFGKLLEIPPPLIVLGRVCFASLTLGLVAFARKANLRPGSWTAVAGLGGSGLLLAFHWTTFFQSIQTSTVAVGLVSFATFPFFVTFLEPLLLGERLHPRSVALALITLVGAAIVAFGPALGGLSPGESLWSAASVGAKGNTLAGVLWGLASAASFALLSILNKRNAQRLSSITIAFHQDLMAAVALAFLLAIAGGSQMPTMRDLGLLALLGVFCTALAHTLFIASLRRVKARTASILGSLEPLYGALFAFLFLGETPSAWTFVGGAVIIGAALLSAMEAVPEKGSGRAPPLA